MLEEELLVRQRLTLELRSKIILLEAKMQETNERTDKVKVDTERVARLNERMGIWRILLV